MIGFKAGDARQSFFDSDKVLNAADKAQRGVLSKVGAYTRRTAKGLIKKRKGPSQPGQPPSDNTGLLKKFLFFVYDRETKSVVVGPQKLNQVFFNGAGQPVSGTVPQVLEEGGTIQVLERQLYGGRWYRADLRSKRRLAEAQARGETRLRKVKIAARPYMGPAFEKEKPKLMDLISDSIKAS